MATLKYQELCPLLPSLLHTANDRILQSQPDRIRMTMFPETICEGEEVPSTQMVPSHHTNLQRLAQPAQILKAAISGLATYQVGGCVCLEKGKGHFEQLVVIICGVYLWVSR